MKIEAFYRHDKQFFQHERGEDEEVALLEFKRRYDQ